MAAHLNKTGMYEVQCGNASSGAGSGAGSARRSAFDFPSNGLLSTRNQKAITQEPLRRVTITHGGSCDVTCLPGYTLSNRHTCHLGTLTAGDCGPNACTMGTAQNPTNGAYNGAGSTCQNTLAHGSECTPGCNVGYTLKPNPIKWRCHLGGVLNASSGLAPVGLLDNCVTKTAEAGSATIRQTVNMLTLSGASATVSAFIPNIRTAFRLGYASVLTLYNITSSSWFVSTSGEIGSTDMEVVANNGRRAGVDLNYNSYVPAQFASAASNAANQLAASGGKNTLANAVNQAYGSNLVSASDIGSISTPITTYATGASGSSSSNVGLIVGVTLGVTATVGIGAGAGWYFYSQKMPGKSTTQPVSPEA